MPSPLDCLLISDGRPGHFHLAEGVLAAIERRRPVTLTRIEVRRPRWLTPGMLWRLSQSGLSPALILGYCYGLDASALKPAQLVVSAGGDTLAANVAASRLLGAANLFYGSLRRYDPLAFSLVLTSYARNADRPRHAMTLKPSRLDPDTLPALPARKAGTYPAMAGLLVGGDAGTVRYAAADWARLLDFLDQTQAAGGTRWIVSNSPRTPPDVSQSLAAKASAGGPIARFIDIRTTGTGTLTALFAAAEAVVCTADSSSMLSEAVWARRPVVAIAPAAMSLPGDEQDYRGYLERNGWATAQAIAALDPPRFVAALDAIRPLDRNPLDTLASLLDERLGLPAGGAP